MEGKIILYKGAKGKGKTLTMTKDALKYYMNGWKVLRNLHEVKFGEYISTEEILEIDKNSLIKDCILLVDEIQIFFDARRSGRKQNLNFSNFVQQVRKRGIILLCTTQYANTVDLRLRQHLDVLAYPKYIKELKVCEVLYVDLTTIEDGLLGGLTEPEYVKIVYDAEPIFKLYNTHEVVV